MIAVAFVLGGVLGLIGTLVALLTGQSVAVALAMYPAVGFATVLAVISVAALVHLLAPVARQQSGSIRGN